MNTAENTADKVLHELQEITLQGYMGLQWCRRYWWVQENSARRDFKKKKLLLTLVPTSESAC